MALEWPIADFEHRTRLDEHLENVTAFSLGFFGEKLRRLKVAGSPRLEGALALASALHDLGKSSEAYMGRGNFSLHEHVSAIIVYEASKKCSSEEGRRVLELAAKAIARHHVAMGDRRPHVVARERQHEVLAALSGVRPEHSRRALSWIGELAGLVEETIQGLNPDIGHVEGTLNYLSRLRGPGERRAVWIVSGYLIVSDILVASYERGLKRGEGGEEGLRAYSIYWLRELGMEELKEVGDKLKELRENKTYLTVLRDSTWGCKT